MPKGGTRVRSGPAADPNSGRSEKRGISSAPGGVVMLPSEGHRGRAPAFPLPETKRDTAALTRSFRSREIAVWREIWKTPQAAQWQRESWRWSTIGEFCRIKAAVELDPDSNAALVSRLREYRNECGLSPDGLKANGWAIAPDQVAQQAAKKTTATKAKPATAPTRRPLRSVGGGS